MVSFYVLINRNKHFLMINIFAIPSPDKDLLRQTMTASPSAQALCQTIYANRPLALRLAWKNFARELL